MFETFYLSSSPDAPEPPSPTTDAGFVVSKNGLDDLACAAFDFVTPLVRLPKAKGDMVRERGGVEAAGMVPDALIHCVLVYMRVTRTNVSKIRIDTQPQHKVADLA